MSRLIWSPMVRGLSLPTPQNREQWDAFWIAVFDEAQADPHKAFYWWVRLFPTWKGHQTLRLLNFCMDKIMARGKNGNSASQSNGGFQQTKFIDIAVLESDWADVVKMYGSSDVLVDAVTDLLDSGYRVGLSHNDQNDAFICSVTCRNPADENNGYTFNAFAETWFEALQLAVFKHYVKAGRKWVTGGGKTSRPKFG